MEPENFNFNFTFEPINLLFSYFLPCAVRLIAIDFFFSVNDIFFIEISYNSKFKSNLLMDMDPPDIIRIWLGGKQAHNSFLLNLRKSNDSIQRSIANGQS